jgi:hypothetical protein
MRNHLLPFFAEKAKGHMLSQTNHYKNIPREQRNITQVFKKLSTIFLLHPSVACHEQT